MPSRPPAEAPFEAFAKCGDRLLLIGGNAMIAYGSDRLTQDCDCAVVTEDERLVAAMLQPLGYLFKERFSTFARYVHLGGSRPVVDVMLLPRETFTKLSAESQQIELDGVPMRAPKPLHLVALKLHALKQNPKRVGKDWADICHLLRTTAWAPGELKLLVERYASAETVTMLRDEHFL